MTQASSVINDNCSICRSQFFDPIVLPCGHSFDRRCIRECVQHSNAQAQIPVESRTIGCPLCRKHFRSNVKFIDEWNSRQVVQSMENMAIPVYEIFVIDTSSSMWFSDEFFGTARLTVAKDFLREILNERKRSGKNLIACYYFNASTNQLFDFSVIDDNEISSIDLLTPDTSFFTKKTAVYDSISDCMQKFQNEIRGANILQESERKIYVLSDGCDNRSRPSSIQRYQLISQRLAKEATIEGTFIQIGLKNLKTGKSVANLLRYRFHHFGSGNAALFTRGFLSENPSEHNRFVAHHTSL
ncbi:unnamed protein product, partial [Didymodactylos carnosus]